MLDPTISKTLGSFLSFLVFVTLFGITFLGFENTFWNFFLAIVYFLSLIQPAGSFEEEEGGG